MQVAHDSADFKRLAWETEKSQGPFHCPECNGALILKKGRVREHHFAHEPPSLASMVVANQKYIIGLNVSYLLRFLPTPSVKIVSLKGALRASDLKSVFA